MASGLSKNVMNTTNTPDRDEVMPLKHILADLHIMLTHPDSKLNEWERKAVASAKFLLEQDKEDGKDRERLDFLQDSLNYWALVRTWDARVGRIIRMESPFSHDHETVREAIDSAMAATTEKGEG